MMAHKEAGVALALLAVLASGPVRAEAPWAPAQSWLLGDWGGVRSKLLQDGVDFQLGYVNELAFNAAGGTSQRVEYADQVQVGTTLNLERLAGFTNALFQATITVRTGWNLSQSAGLNTLQLVQEVWGRGQTARITELWFSKGFFDGLVDWKFGRIAMGGDFAAFSCSFQNLTFCGSAPGNIQGDYIYNWPISQWGTRLQLKLEGFGYFNVAAYDQNERYLSFDDPVLPVWYQGSSGALLPVELAWLPAFGGGKLPGSYKIGGWYSTQTMNDVVLDINGGLAALSGLPHARHKGAYGGYINFHQQITRNSSPHPRAGLNVFLNATFADNETAEQDYQIAAGMIYTGPFESRPNDSIALAIGTTHVNGRIANLQSQQNAMGLGPVPIQGSEYVFELYYTFVPRPGLNIRPNLQYVVNPGGVSTVSDVVVLGLKTEFTF